jgi:hypothetical protein
MFLQHIRHAAGVFVKLTVGDFLVVVGIVAFPDDGSLVAALLKMPVDAIDRDIGDTVLVPFD